MICAYSRWQVDAPSAQFGTMYGHGGATYRKMLPDISSTHRTPAPHIAHCYENTVLLANFANKTVFS